MVNLTHIIIFLNEYPDDQKSSLYDSLYQSAQRTGRKPLLLFTPPFVRLKLKAPALPPLFQLPPRLNHGLPVASYSLIPIFHIG